MTETHCLAAKHNLFFDTNSHPKLCCNSSQPLEFSAPVETILQSPKVVEIQQALEQNIPHENCQTCWVEQGQGGRSYRYSYNDMYPEFETQTGLKTVHMQYDNTCNLTCVYCGPKYSSSWGALTRGTISQKHHIEFSDETVAGLRSVTLAGGEPTLVKAYVDLLEKIKTINPDCEVTINTNLTQVENNVIFDHLRSIKTVTVIASFEATDQQYEYIRSGAQWKQFSENFDRVLDLGFRLQASMVWFPLSACVIDRAIDWSLSKIPDNEIYINNYEGDQLTWNQIGQTAIDRIKHNLLQYTKQIPKSVADQLVNKLESLPNGSQQTRIAHLDNFDQLTKSNHKILFKELYE